MKKVFSTAFSAILLFTLINNAYGQTEIYVPNGTAGIGTSTSTGKVGIGLNNPAEKLDVLGNVKVSGNILLYGANRTIETNSTYSLFIKTAGSNRVKFDYTGKTLFYGSIYLPQTSNLVLGLDNPSDNVNSLKIHYSTIYNHAFINYKDNLIFRTGLLTYSPLTMQGDGSIAVGYPINYLNDGTQYQTQGYKFAVNGTALFEDKVTFKGNVGIGTDNLETATLMVYKDALPNFVLKSALAKLQIGIASSTGEFAPSSKPGDVVFRNLGGTNSNNLIFSIPNNSNDGNSYISFGDSNDSQWFKILNNKTVSINGGVGIKTPSAAGYALAVNGKIIATEIVVKEFGNWEWPDYVFANSYNLRSLDEVENFINENGHLPEVPSAKMVEVTGVGVGEMNAILLKKVEELTLYAIQQGKLIKALEEKLEKLEATK